MLTKIIKIRNVGRLRKVDAAGDVEFRRITLIFAENARGKTTLCDILRSLKTGNGEYISGRHTLTTGEAPEVQLLFDDGMVHYRDGAWNGLHSEIEIFDSTFVHENVYAGEYVDHEHKRNLYRVIVGEEGVRLARRVDELDAEMRDVDRDLSQKREKVERFLPQGISLNAFLALGKDDRIDERIRSAETEVAALTRSGEIKSKAELGQLDLPELPVELAEIVSRRLEDVAADVERLVRTHLDDKTERASEGWVSEGLGYIREELCPFCEQPIHSLELVSAYRAYFGESYRTLKKQVETLRGRVEALATEAAALRLEQTAARNADFLEFWSQFLIFQRPEVQLEEVRGALGDLARSALAVIRRKVGAILEPVQLGTEFLEAQLRFGAAKQKVAAYNEAVAAVNALIRAKKAETETGNLADAKARLARLQATKARHEDDAKAAIDEYESAINEKGRLQEVKGSAKDRLNKYSEEILRRFENRINELLELFGASFRIWRTTRQYLGGRPSSTYQVLINGVAVELGDSNTSIGTPSFRNTLSAGDRSTLALGFFIAQAELDPQISNKVLVFDDPYSSQDRSRRTCTQQQICRLSQKCDQTVILSHEPSFLRSIWDAVEQGKVRSLQLTRIGEHNSTVNPWNIEDETRGEYFQKLKLLKMFADEGRGEPRHVAQTIRPIVEEYLRFNWPGTFPDTQWLGDFLEKIDQAEEGEPLYALKDALADLEDINDYAKRYHHATNPGAATEPIDNGELEIFVKRTLRLVSTY